MITPSSISIILHMIRKLNSIIVNYAPKVSKKYQVSKVHSAQGALTLFHTVAKLQRGVWSVILNLRSV